MKIARLVPATLLLLLPALPPAARAQVVETPEGKVEFIGLERWTIEDIKKAMAEKAPGQPLGGCAAVLQQDLGFPSASVIQVQTPDQPPYTVVAVVEPHRAGEVKKKPPFTDSRPDLPAWQEAIAILKKENPSFHAAVQLYRAPQERVEIYFQRVGQRVKPETVRRVWSFLESHRSEADRDLALWTLANDGNYENRMVAAALLANFGDRDLTWWTLLDAQRDPIGSVSTTASTVLQGLAQREKRKVDWQPALGSIRHLLQGAELFAFQPTLNVLVATGLPTDLAPALLADGGGELLLDHLGAHFEMPRKAPHKLLTYLSGKDYGTDVAAWRKWVDGLAKPAA